MFVKHFVYFVIWYFTDVEGVCLKDTWIDHEDELLGKVIPAFKCGALKRITRQQRLPVCDMNHNTKTPNPKM